MSLFWGKLDCQVFQMMFLCCCFFTLEYMATIGFYCIGIKWKSFPPLNSRTVENVTKASIDTVVCRTFVKLSILGELPLYWRCCNLVNSRVQITYNYSFWMKSGIDGVPPWHVHRPQCGRLRRNTGSRVFLEGKKKMENHLLDHGTRCQDKVFARLKGSCVLWVKNSTQSVECFSCYKFS